MPNRVLMAAAAAAGSACALGQGLPLPTYSADRIALRLPFHVAAINGQGDLAGRKDVGERSYIAFRQTAGGEPTMFADLKGGERRGAALAINSAGVAVGYGTVEEPAPGDTANHPGARALIFAADDTVFDISPVLPRYSSSVAWAINDVGQVAGTAYPAFGSSSLAFVWTETIGTHVIPKPRHDVRMTATAINDLGHVAGFIVDDGYVWSHGQGRRVFGDRLTSVNAINNDDHVVGQDRLARAYVWKPRIGIRLLPPITDYRHSARCEARHVNNLGAIVGWCSDPREHHPRGPVMWLPDGNDYVFVDLFKQILPSRHVPAFAQAEAMHIDEAGRVLVEVMITRDGANETHYYLLTPNP